MATAAYNKLAAAWPWKADSIGAPTDGIQADGKCITLIHGKYYDLTRFRDQHPGGTVAMDLAADRDATALFESYHPLTRDRAWAKLQKLECKAGSFDATTRFKDIARFGDMDSMFDWELDKGGSAFRKDLVAYAKEYFTEEKKRRGFADSDPLWKATKCPPIRWASIWLSAIPYHVAAYYMYHGSWTWMCASPFLAWLWSVNFWHESLHFAHSPDWRVNFLIPYTFPFFYSPHLWNHSHVIGHHVHTNDPDRDPDCNVAPHVLRFAPQLPWSKGHKKMKSVVYCVALWTQTISGLTFLVRDSVNRASGWQKTVPITFPSHARKWAHIFGRVATAFLLAGWPFMKFNFLKAFAFASIPSMIFSAIFVANANINHINEENAHRGFEYSDTDWFKHQVHTSSSHSKTGTVWGMIWFVISGGLSLQIEHHLFPGFNHMHLYYMSPQIKKICEKHNVRYTSFGSMTAALTAHFNFCAKMADEDYTWTPTKPANVLDDGQGTARPGSPGSKKGN
jgi:fatty acid desaturase